MSLFTALASGYIRTHTFRQLGPEGHNISVERSISGVEIKHHNLDLRADDDDDPDTIRWKKAVCKGDELLDAMAGDERRAGQWFRTPKESGDSEYQDFSKDQFSIVKKESNTSIGELAKWGYGDAAWDDYYDLDASLPIKKALAGLGVDTRTIKEDGHNRCMQLEHEVEVAVDGTTYTPTAAYFTTVFNPVEGVIIAWGSYGTRYMGLQQKPPVTVLPKLQSWSDIAWLQWAKIAGEKAKDLRFVFRSPVANTEAQWLISRAFRLSGKELSIWPGVEFDMTTAEGKAILSSPNGAGVAYLLFTHKRHLGRKTISKVTVFADDGKKQPRPPSLIYHVVDAPPMESEGEKSAVKRIDSVLERLAKYFVY
jgi:hypothetical protein